jgi:hypothetical protein
MQLEVAMTDEVGYTLTEGNHRVSPDGSLLRVAVMLDDDQINRLRECIESRQDDLEIMEPEDYEDCDDGFHPEVEMNMLEEIKLVLDMAQPHRGLVA